MNTIKTIVRPYYEGAMMWLINVLVTNIPSVRMRIWLFKMLGMKTYGAVKFYAGVHVRNPKGIVLEEGASIGPKVLLDGRSGLKIGRSAVIAYEAIVWTLNHDFNDVRFCGKGAPVEIGAYAWVCSRSIILPGITIGEGAVVASGAVVTHDVPPYAVVAGVPAKVIGMRERKKYCYGYDLSRKAHFY